MYLYLERIHSIRLVLVHGIHICHGMHQWKVNLPQDFQNGIQYGWVQDRFQGILYIYKIIWMFICNRKREYSQCKTIGKSWEMIWLHVLKFYLMLLICHPTLPSRWFVLCFWNLLLCFYYNDSCNQHNYYASTMNTFESEYPFGGFLEDYKFDELSEYLQPY